MAIVAESAAVSQIQLLNLGLEYAHDYWHVLCYEDPLTHLVGRLGSDWFLYRLLIIEGTLLLLLILIVHMRRKGVFIVLELRR